MSRYIEPPDKSRGLQENPVGNSAPTAPRPRRKRRSRKVRVGLPPGLADAFSRMPELCHNPFPDLPFEIGRSELVNWLVGTAMVDLAFRQALYDAAYRAHLIVFDREKHTWRGCAHGTVTHV